MCNFPFHLHLYDLHDLYDVTVLLVYIHKLSVGGNQQDHIISYCILLSVCLILIFVV